MLKAEATTIGRNNQKLRARGQHVSPEREEAAEFSSWMDRFVRSRGSEGCRWLIIRLSNLGVMTKDALALIVSLIDEFVLKSSARERRSTVCQRDG